MRRHVSAGIPGNTLTAQGPRQASLLGLVFCALLIPVLACAQSMDAAGTGVRQSVSASDGVPRIESAGPALAPASSIRFTILHTNDFHSQLAGLGPDSMLTPAPSDGDPVRGNAARLMTAIRQVRADRRKKGGSVLLVDAGDSLFGSLYHILAPSPVSAWVPEYSFFDAAGYDALALGNHDFDADEKGLALALRKAQKAKVRLPFVCSNVRPAAAGQEASPLAPFLQRGGGLRPGVGLQAFQVRDLPARPGEAPVRLGILGLVGPNAAQLSVATRKNLQFIGFQDLGTKTMYDEFHKDVQTKVDELRKRYDCQLIMILLHGGAPEDEDLAKAVRGIDIIIAAHTHLPYVKQVGTTVIAQSGHGGGNLGVLDFETGPTGVKLLNPDRARISIDDRVPAAPDVLAWLRKASAEVDRIIAPAGFLMADPICEVTQDRRKARFPNDAAGVFVATTLRRAVNRHLAEPVDVYFSSYGMVRSEFLTVNGRPTPYAFSDVFRFSPLGFDDAGRPGAPIVVFTLSALETKLLLEVMTYLSKATLPYEPAVSESLQYKLNKIGVPLVNKLGDLKLHGQPFRKWPKRVRIATTLFFGKNLFKIRDLTKGIIRITPRDEQGNAITEFKDVGLPREHILLAEELRKVQQGEVDDPAALP